MKKVYTYIQPVNNKALNLDLSDYYKKSEIDNKISNLNALKVNKEDGKVLSTNDYTTTEKNKLAGIEANANKYSHPSTHKATMIAQDATHRFVTDEEKANWNAKSNFSGNYNDLEGKPTIPVVDVTKAYVDAEISLLRQYIDGNKELIASAISEKGIDATSDDTFEELANKISQI